MSRGCIQIWCLLSISIPDQAACSLAQDISPQPHSVPIRPQHTTWHESTGTRLLPTTLGSTDYWYSDLACGSGNNDHVSNNISEKLHWLYVVDMWRVKAGPRHHSQPQCHPQHLITDQSPDPGQTLTLPATSTSRELTKIALLLSPLYPAPTGQPRYFNK